jgi:hypothetical protein
MNGNTTFTLRARNETVHAVQYCFLPFLYRVVDYGFGSSRKLSVQMLTLLSCISRY